MKQLLAVLALALGAPAGCRAPDPAATAKPDLYVITALPLLFGETFSTEFEPPPVTRAIEERFALKPVDLPSQVPAGATLLMAQPRALPAEELVHLDNWLRAGGRLVLLADPRLEWPSKRPLGDPLRPPPMFADTGLLQHWGIRLDAPDKSGPMKVGGVTYFSPGRLVRSGGPCAVEVSGVVARCRPGTGQAVIVADADWLDSGLVTNNGGTPDSQFEALDALLDGLSR